MKLISLLIGVCKALLITPEFLSSIHLLPLVQKFLSYLTEVQRKGEKLGAETVSILGAGHKMAI